ncbi:MAG: NHLP leader peptide family RiPP precursor [Selenomonadaceae bacterium]|nr:NHLP leader peptide family RiPP precursor [Selenomonadaceae bacterium]
MSEKNNLVLYGEIVAKCWEDEAYKKRFLEDPEGVMQEAGMVLEEGVTYKVIEAPKLVKYMVLPQEQPQRAVEELAKTLLNKAEASDKLIPEGVELRIVQNTEDIRYFVLPASPKTFTKAELAAVAGGDWTYTTNHVAMVNEAAVNQVEAVSVGTTAQAAGEVEVVAVLAGVVF